MTVQSTDAAAERQTLILPQVQPLYAALGNVSETLLRVIAGLILAVHGWPKIQAPLGNVGMVESIGFYPGWFWSPALAGTEFFGGLLLMAGLLTRPVAAAATFILLVTTWFHWVRLEQGFGGAELSMIWAAVMFFFFVRGGGRHSLDRLIGRQF